MRTIEYNLLSKPGKKIKLPEGTLAHAKHFFELAKSAENKRNVLIEMLDNDPVFKDMEPFLKENLSHMNYKFNKYRLSKDKDLIYVLIGSFELNNMYSQLEKIGQEIDQSLNYL